LLKISKEGREDLDIFAKEYLLPKIFTFDAKVEYELPKQFLLLYPDDQHPSKMKGEIEFFLKNAILETQYSTFSTSLPKNDLCFFRILLTKYIFQIDPSKKLYLLPEDSDEIIIYNPFLGEFYSRSYQNSYGKEKAFELIKLMIEIRLEEEKSTIAKPISQTANTLGILDYQLNGNYLQIHVDAICNDFSGNRIAVLCLDQKDQKILQLVNSFYCSLKQQFLML